MAYNAGTLNRTAEAGVRHVEVFDRFDCDWLTDTDLDKANGTIRACRKLLAL
ncbi:hypothetical protein OG241_09345 [Streptomyces sp. NBC_01390]|uniref:hypothetical protein n=1 Tax=unclassified Streptomyces TaxID=2593676 RepID=UPI0032501530